MPNTIFDLIEDARNFGVQCVNLLLQGLEVASFGALLSRDLFSHQCRKRFHVRGLQEFALKDWPEHGPQRGLG